MLAPGIPADREGFRGLYESHRDAIHRLLARLARDAQHAEDLLQETFLTVWRKRDQFRGDGSLEGWMKTIAVRTYLNARPRLVRGVAETGLDADPAAPTPAPDDLVALRADRTALLAEVRAAVDARPDSWREPFVLFRYEGMTCAQVAQLLGLTPKAVELRLARALRAVADRVRAVLPARVRLEARES
jgi:RNA polymerase sigma-70 factor (ECF subfamily)